MKFYKAFKMAPRGEVGEGLETYLSSQECCKNGDFIDIRVPYHGYKVSGEVFRMPDVEIEVYPLAKRCMENATVCGYPYFFKVEVPESALIEENKKYGYAVVKEFRLVRELDFDEMMALVVKEESYARVLCESETETAGKSDETEGKCGECGDAHTRGDVAFRAVVEVATIYRKASEILLKNKKALEGEKAELEKRLADAAVRRRKEQDFLARVERENKRLRSENLERKRLLPFWLSAVAIFGAVIGYFIGILLGLTI